MHSMLSRLGVATGTAVDGGSGTIHHPGPMRVIVFATVCGLLCPALSPGPALAGGDYFGEDAPEDQITFRKYKERSNRQRLIIGALFGGAALFGGVGLYFNFDARSKSDEVSVVGNHTGLTYTQDLEDTRTGALRSRNVAIASYSVGGLFLIGAIVAFYLTDPGSEVVSVGDEEPPGPTVPVTVAPIPGGAVVGGTWRF